MYALLKSNRTNVRPLLNYHQPYELLIANILLEHCSYNEVNAVTKKLYKKYQSIIDFAYCNLESLEVDIDRIENYKQKAQNIIQACSIIINDYKLGSFKDTVNSRIIEDYLYTSGIPNPDLLIRTGGEYRISNFLLWQIAYSEIYFTNIFWPAFREDDLIAAIKEYQRRERRFGKVNRVEC